MSDSDNFNHWKEIMDEFFKENSKGKWTVDIETHIGWDADDDPDEHFEEDKDLFEI